jgi:hypothetical protein
VQDNGRCALYNLLLIGSADAAKVWTVLIGYNIMRSSSYDLQMADKARAIAAENTALRAQLLASASKTPAASVLPPPLPGGQPQSQQNQPQPQPQPGRASRGAVNQLAILAGAGIPSSTPIAGVADGSDTTIATAATIGTADAIDAAHPSQLGSSAAGGGGTPISAAHLRRSGSSGAGFAQSAARAPVASAERLAFTPLDASGAPVATPATRRPGAAGPGPAANTPRSAAGAGGVLAGAGQAVANPMLTMAAAGAGAGARSPSLPADAVAVPMPLPLPLPPSATPQTTTTAVQDWIERPPSPSRGLRAQFTPAFYVVLVLLLGAIAALIVGFVVPR